MEATCREDERTKMEERKDAELELERIRLTSFF